MHKLGLALTVLLASTALAGAAFLTGDMEIGGGTNSIAITTQSPPTGTISWSAGSTVLTSGTSGTFTGFIGDAVNFPTGVHDFNALTAINPFITVDTTGPSFTLTSEIVSLTSIGGGQQAFDISGNGIFHLTGFTDTPGQFTYSSQTIGGTFVNTSFSASTMAVPGPIVGAGLPGLLSLLWGGGVWWRRKRRLA